MSKRAEILKEAEKCICGQREQDYGSPEAREGKKITWGDIYKQFRTDYPEMEVKDYRPFAEYYLPDNAIGIIVWLKNGDVLIYIPKEV